eukprot:CAMPEP_0170489950 /NCGR_PEP_ID=MMETSP0208-20121228/8242_1 /TAXON_ID=197538 /ORGANISM="Strombidium inclinatum, Strain S3" /LENGTH=142 /DNA_ID=CAMNT_0010765125 /DNA_START=817 /DNA_END=1242 /DNA_ORIENTATION=+
MSPILSISPPTLQECKISEESKGEKMMTNLVKTLSKYIEAPEADRLPFLALSIKSELTQLPVPSGMKPPTTAKELLSLKGLILSERIRSLSSCSFNQMTNLEALQENYKKLDTGLIDAFKQAKQLSDAPVEEKLNQSLVLGL